MNGVREVHGSQWSQLCWRVFQDVSTCRGIRGSVAFWRLLVGAIFDGSNFTKVQFFDRFDAASKYMVSHLCVTCCHKEYSGAKWSIVRPNNPFLQMKMTFFRSFHTFSWLEIFLSPCLQNSLLWAALRMLLHLQSSRQPASSRFSQRASSLELTKNGDFISFHNILSDSMAIMSKGWVASSVTKCLKAKSTTERKEQSLYVASRKSQQLTGRKENHAV